MARDQKKSTSGKEFFDHVPRDVSETVIAAFETIGQLGVINAQTVEQGGVEIVHMHWIFDDVVAEVVGFSQRETLLNSAASHPNAEAARVMIAAKAVFLDFSLTVS